MMATDILAQLLREAHSEYKANVPSKMTSRIFARQFINGHRYGNGTTITEKNNHCQALGMVEVLLTKRTDLVGRYFGNPELTDGDIAEMMRLLYTETRIDDDDNPIVHNPLRCSLSDEDWPVIMECVNKNHIFNRDVTEDEIRGFLLCTLVEPLVIEDSNGLCYLLDKLSTGGFITHKWQKHLAESKAFLSKRTNDFVTATSLSSTLSRERREEARPYAADIDLLLKHLKSKSTPNL